MVRSKGYGCSGAPASVLIKNMPAITTTVRAHANAKILDERWREEWNEEYIAR